MNFYFAFIVTCFTLALGDTLAANLVSRALQFCAVGEDVVSISISTDQYPEDTSWRFYNTCTDEVLLTGSNYASAYTLYPENDFCVAADGSYTFEISDSYGDGICCEYGNGIYTVSVGEVIKTGGVFDDVETVNFGFSCDCVDSPNSYEGKTCAFVAQDPEVRCPMCLGGGTVCAIDYCLRTCDICELESNAPSTVPSTAPTVDYGCSETEVIASIEVYTDNYPGENTWTLSETCPEQQEITSGGSDYGPNTMYQWIDCVPKVDAYTFEIFDTYSDGLCCTFGNGYYSVTVDNITVTGGDFVGAVETVYLGPGVEVNATTYDCESSEDEDD